MPTEAKAKPIVYSVETDRVFRDDGVDKESVARYDSQKGIVEMLPGKHNYRVAVIRHLNDKGFKYSTVGKIGMDTDRSKAPPKPKKSRLQGEKTPEVVEWYARYFPEEFLAKYSVRELQIRTRFDEVTERIRDKETGKIQETIKRYPVYEPTDHLNYDIEKLKTGEQRLIADCKTDLTEKLVESMRSDEYDDEKDVAINRENERIRKGGVV